MSMKMLVRSYQVSDLPVMMIPEGMTRIEKATFSDCWKLKRITLPESLVSIGEETLDGLKIVLDALGKTNRVQEEVEEIMGGRVLEFSADKIYDAGKEEGREEGRMEGREEGRMKGREEGRMEGREEGRMEGREEGRMEGREEGLTQGEDRGKIRTLWGLVEDKILSKETAAARAGLSIDDFSEKAKKILAEPAEKYEES